MEVAGLPYLWGDEEPAEEYPEKFGEETGQDSACFLVLWGMREEVGTVRVWMVCEQWMLERALQND